MIAKQAEDLKNANRREEEAKNKFAKYLLSEGKSVDEVVTITGLDKISVLSLKNGDQ